VEFILPILKLLVCVSWPRVGVGVVGHYPGLRSSVQINADWRTLFGGYCTPGHQSDTHPFQAVIAFFGQFTEMVLTSWL
jgi:hypothetical protein